MQNNVGIFNGNPTAGGTDGAEVSQNGVLSNPISASIRTGTQKIKCAVRCETGMHADGALQIKVVTRTGGGYQDGHEGIKVCTTQNGTYADSISLSNVDDTNTLFWVRLAAGQQAGTDATGALRLQGVIVGG